MYLSHREKHSGKSSSIREAVFGLEDGIVSTLGAVVGIAIGTQDKFIVILSGMVVVAVEALSMAAGTYLSSKSQREIAERYLEEEKWEIENRPKEEEEELRQIYKKRGFNKKEIDILVKRITSDKKLWLEEMAFHELKIIPDEGESPKRNAWIMWISYIVGGVIPLASFFFLPISVAIWTAVISGGAALFILGVAVTKITYRNWLRSGSEMLIVAMSAAAIGFIVAQVVQALFPLLR